MLDLRTCPTLIHRFSSPGAAMPLPVSTTVEGSLPAVLIFFSRLSFSGEDTPSVLDNPVSVVLVLLPVFCYAVHVTSWLQV